MRLKKGCLILTILLIPVFCSLASVEGADSFFDDQKRLLEEMAVNALDRQHAAPGIDRRADGVRSAWFSKNATDLDPIKDSKWNFTYQISQSITRALTFGAAATVLSDGTVTLSCNEGNRQGAVFYTELPQGGYGFSAGLEGATLFESFFFTVNGGNATGIYLSKNKNTGSYSNSYRLTGVREYTEQDVTRAYDNGYADGCAACSLVTPKAASLSPDLSIYILSLQFTTPLGETYNYWANFVYFGASDGKHLWKLSALGENSQPPTPDPLPTPPYTAEDVTNAYNNGYAVGCATCSQGNIEATALQSDLSFHIPSLQYETPTGQIYYWADFEYFGERDGQYLWELSGLGETDRN